MCYSAAMERNKTHRSFSASFKLKVREWCQSKETLKEWKKSRKRATGAGRTVRFPAIDESLIRWFTERRAAGVRVTGKGLKHEALRLHRENGSQSFKASCGWFASFKRRHNISFRRSTHIAQKSVEITDGLVDKFLRYVIRMRRLRDYDPADIANMDETPVYLEMPGKATYNIRGQNEITVTSTGHEKEKITVTLGAYADGTKMSPLVHLTGVRPLPKDDIPSGIIVYMCGSGKKSWANEQSILFWLRKLWGRNNARRRFLVWDAFRGHLTDAVKEFVRQQCNTDMCVIPGGCTSRLQPADVSWNKPFKARMGELYDEWLFSGLVQKTPKGNRKAPPKPLLLQWIKTSWNSVTPETIRKSFKKCGITVAMDGSEDHLFSQDSDDSATSDFEGFDPVDVEMAVQVRDNIASTSRTGVSLSDSDQHSSTDTGDSSDYDSPGH